MLEFQLGTTAKPTSSGRSFNLENDVVGAVIFGDYLKIKENARFDRQQHRATPLRPRRRGQSSTAS